MMKKNKSKTSEKASESSHPISFNKGYNYSIRNMSCYGDDRKYNWEDTR